MHDGSIIFNTKIDNANVEKDLKDLERKIRKAEESISENESKKLPLLNQADELGDKLKEAQREAARLKTEMSGIDQALTGADAVAYTEAVVKKPQVAADLKNQEAEVAKLRKQWDSTVKKIDQYDQKIQRAEETIVGCKEKAAELTGQTNKCGAAMENAFAKAKASAISFEKRVVSLGKRILVFTAIANAFRGIKNYMGTLLKTNKQYTTQLAKLKAALATAFQPIYEYVLPGLITALQVLTDIAAALAGIISTLFDTTLKNSASAAEKINQEANAMEKLGKETKKTTGNLAGFDEINKMSSGTDISAESSASSEEMTLNFEDFNTDEYINKINELQKYMEGALLAIGAILTFSGANITLGISLMAMGATALYKDASNMDWNCMSKYLKGADGIIVATLSAMFLAIGAILAFSGWNVPLGIGLLAVGAVGMAAYASINWNSLDPVLAKALECSVLILRSSLLAVGALLAFTGANLLLGIGLMIAGAISLAEYAIVNWNSIPQALQGPIGVVAGIIGAAALVFGAILAFSGANVPLGLGLMAVGAAGLATAIAPNWNFIKEKLQAAWTGIKEWFNSYVKPVFTAKHWQEKFAGIGDGLKTAIKNGINSAIDLFNKFISWVNEKLTFTVPAIKVAGIELTKSTTIQLANIPSIPKLAQGAVIPPNAPFMAMLGDQKHGTNIEAPLSTIQEAVAIVMEDMIQSNIAGHEATVAVLREILEAVLGIHIGDDVIGQAVSRYNTEMAIIRGGSA